MFRRVFIALLLAASLLTCVACKNKKAANPLAQINSKQPDKVLFDRAMEAMTPRASPCRPSSTPIRTLNSSPAPS
jgi:hypothetical protein